MPSGRPPVDGGWAMEASLDVEWAHAIAPKAHILLVEAASDGIDNLMYAIDCARKQPGVVAISMSWGGNEFPGESYYDDVLTTPAGHVAGWGRRGGITFVSASGDSGAPAGWPAVPPNVVAVGGTSLVTDRLGNYKGERAWSGSGGGIGTFEPTNSPDVSYAADPQPGFAVYDSWDAGRLGPWLRVGGTSAGAPQWAGLFAIAAEARNYAGKLSFNTQQALAALYRLPQGDFHDITSGSNGFYAAAVGYDLVTGRGSPFADRIVRDLAKV
jgi:subtilase family serine protease